MALVGTAGGEGKHAMMSAAGMKDVGDYGGCWMNAHDARQEGILAVHMSCAMGIDWQGNAMWGSTSAKKEMAAELAQRSWHARQGRICCEHQLRRNSCWLHHESRGSKVVWKKETLHSQAVLVDSWQKVQGLVVHSDAVSAQRAERVRVVGG